MAFDHLSNSAIGYTIPVGSFSGENAISGPSMPQSVTDLLTMSELANHAPGLALELQFLPPIPVGTLSSRTTSHTFSIGDHQVSFDVTVIIDSPTSTGFITAQRLTAIDTSMNNIAVPEPATAALALLGLTAMGMRRRIRA